MERSKKVFKTIDEYIAEFPEEIQEILENVRKTIRKSVPPEAIESIAYQMPTFKLKKKNLVHFAAYKNHIGFYPTPSGIKIFEKELSEYETSKGAIRFPLNKPIPYDLIQKIVQFRAKEIIEKQIT
ncbi:MAG: iron chaperone [Candidatus Thorarchaeota archaeon]